MYTHSQMQKFIVFKSMFLFLKYHAYTQYTKITFTPPTTHLIPHLLPIYSDPIFSSRLVPQLSLMSIIHLLLFSSEINSVSIRLCVFMIETLMAGPENFARLYFSPSSTVHSSPTLSSMMFPGRQRSNIHAPFQANHSTVIYSQHID